MSLVFPDPAEFCFFISRIFSNGFGGTFVGDFGSDFASGIAQFYFGSCIIQGEFGIGMSECQFFAGFDN